MEQKHAQLKGFQDILDVYTDKVCITPPSGFFSMGAKGLQGTKTIPFRSITAIQLKRAGFLSGYLQFSILGGNESRGGLMAAVKDENTFVFTKKLNGEVEKIKIYIEERIKTLSVTQAAPTSVVDELSKLSNLKTNGAISEDEFAEMKNQIIKRFGAG